MKRQFRKNSWIQHAILILCLMFQTSLMAAEVWPTKPIKVIIPFAAGGTTDILGRLLVQKLSEILGQSVIIENRGGAGGNIGAQVVAEAPGDGYTILLASGSMMTVNPLLYKKIPFSYQKDLIFITPVASVPSLITVSPKLNVSTLQELVNLGKVRTLTFGSAGVGSQIHMAGENLSYVNGLQTTHVPYKGELPALNDIASGEVDFMVGNLPAGVGLSLSGKVKAVAVTSKERSKQLPQVPTVAEAGFPKLENSGWYALGVPSGTPEPIIQKIYEATQTALASSALKESLSASGLVPFIKNQKELEQFIQSETANWKKVIQARNINGN